MTVVPNEGDFETDTVTIPVDEYLALRQRDRMLYCLEAHGISNWEDYEDALGMFLG